MFVMPAAEYGSLHNPVSDRQTVSLLAFACLRCNAWKGKRYRLT
jgi:hypothetical protein